MSGLARYADVEALALAIVHALEDRDSGLIAEVDALRRQVSTLTTMTDRAMSPTLDVTALEAVIEHQPELRRELNGVVEHLLDTARSGRPAAPTMTALLLLMLPLTQSISRRHEALEGKIQALRQEIATRCEEARTFTRSVGATTRSFPATSRPPASA
jgi:CRP-like cAMP-binding protein